MNTDNIAKNLRVLWRTDRIIAEIRMRHMLIGLGLRAFAALIAAFGLLMLELSAYFALVQIWSAIWAAARRFSGARSGVRVSRFRRPRDLPGAGFDRNEKRIRISHGPRKVFNPALSDGG